jgi:hypothetical protein
LIRRGLIILATVMMGLPVQANPSAQASCVYESFPADRLKDYGFSLINAKEERPADLDPLYNAAENACIGQYRWGEAEIASAGLYFTARVSREAIAKLLRDNGFDPVKVDRAYDMVKGQFTSEPNALQENQQMLITALQKQNFQVDGAELLDAVITYVGLKMGEERAIADFTANAKATD